MRAGSCVSAETAMAASGNTTVVLRSSSYLQNSFQKDHFRNVALGGKTDAVITFRGFVRLLAAGESLFSSPTTHRPSHKTGGKNAVVLKIKAGCAATYCKNFFMEKEKLFCKE